MPSLEPRGENAVPSAKAIATAPTPVSLFTSTGQIEEINVPRDRASQFHTQAFDRYRRYEPHIAEGRDGDVCGRDAHGMRNEMPAGK